MRLSSKLIIWVLPKHWSTEKRCKTQLNSHRRSSNPFLNFTATKKRKRKKKISNSNHFLQSSKTLSKHQSQLSIPFKKLKLKTHLLPTIQNQLSIPLKMWKPWIHLQPSLQTLKTPFNPLSTRLDKCSRHLCTQIPSIQSCLRLKNLPSWKRINLKRVLKSAPKQVPPGAQTHLQ